MSVGVLTMNGNGNHEKLLSTAVQVGKGLLLIIGTSIGVVFSLEQVIDNRITAYSQRIEQVIQTNKDQLAQNQRSLSELHRAVARMEGMLSRERESR